MDEILDTLQGALKNEYTVESPIGKGGMATVYLAKEHNPARQVAIKVLDPAVGDLIGRERFLREVEIVAQLTHPHVVPVFRSGEADGLLYYVMPYIRGQSLRARLARENTMAFADAAHITGDIADALGFAHSAGIIHRDIKPENILLSGGHAVVTDFGIARAVSAAHASGVNLTLAGLPIGTPGYMSPEQATGSSDLDQRTDIYSLGCVLYEMLLGERPAVTPNFSMPEPGQDRNGGPEPLPEGISEIFRRSLSWNRDERFATTADFAEALGAMVSVGSVQTVTRWTPTPPPQAPAKSIAVLPFANLSRDPENEYFSDGITEDIIAQLSKIGDLKVTSRTSVMRYKNTEQSLREIASELGVATVLEGSVRRAGERVRIVSQLIDVQTDAHLWADTYDRDLTDVFEIQSDVAAQIANALEATLAPTVAASIKRKPTDDVDAYNAYLQGVYHWNKFSPTSTAKAFQHFEEAIARDQGFALAHAGLANAYLSVALGVGLGSETPQEAFEFAKKTATRALELDDSIADAHATIGSVYFWYDWDWDAAETHFKRAQAKGCGCVEPNIKYGFYLAAMGRHDEGIEIARKALELDPLSLIVNTHLAHQYYWARRATRERRQLEKTLDLNASFPPARVGLAWSYLNANAANKGVEYFERAINDGETFTHAIAGLACAYAAAGRTDDAQRTLDEQLRRKASDDHYVSARDIALMYLWSGDRPKTFEWLERATEERAAWIVFLNVDPMWDAVRGDERFQPILKKIGFPKT